MSGIAVSPIGKGKHIGLQFAYRNEVIVCFDENMVKSI